MNILAQPRKFCATKVNGQMEIWQSQFSNGCCDLEKWVKVKWLVWQKGHGRDNHLAYQKRHCCQKP